MADMKEAKWSVQNGDLEKVKQACSQSGFDINADVGMGRALIHCAADYGQKDVLDYLLSQGANVNALDKHGISPLLNAIFEGHTECVKLLLEKGADKTVKSRKWRKCGGSCRKRRNQKPLTVTTFVVIDVERD